MTLSGRNRGPFFFRASRKILFAASRFLAEPNALPAAERHVLGILSGALYSGLRYAKRAASGSSATRHAFVMNEIVW